MGEWVRETLLLDVPHRQVVLVIPKMLRLFFKFKRKLLGDLCRYAVRALLFYFQAVAGTVLEPGVVAVIQTFGDRINFHPHLHFLVTEGGGDEAGIFHRLSSFDDVRLAEVFAREVLGFLVGRQLLSPEWAECGPRASRRLTKNFWTWIQNIFGKSERGKGRGRAKSKRE